MQIFIKSSSESKRPFTVEPSTNVLELKNMIEQEMKIPTLSQRLIFSGKVLKDSDTMSSASIGDDITIHLVKSVPASNTNIPLPQSTTGNINPYPSTTSEPIGIYIIDIIFISYTNGISEFSRFN